MVDQPAKFGDALGRDGRDLGERGRQDLPQRLARFDESMMQSTMAIDSAVNEKARALTHAMESHVRSLSDTLGQHASHLDESMMHGLDAVRRTSDSVTRQSLNAIEGLSGQADLLKRVPENLLQQMSGVASQGQSIAQAASMLDLGTTQEVAVQAENMTTVIRLLNAEYFVAMALAPGGSLGKARFLLRVQGPKLLERLS